MFNKIPKGDLSINSLIGEGTLFKGELTSNGTLRVDGEFKGKINSKGKVYIGRFGKAGSLIFAKNVTIGGEVEGDIYALDSVLALKTAKIRGNIYAASVRMEDGVHFDGQCRILSKNEMKELVNSKASEKCLI